MSKKKLSKLLALYLPYVVIGLLATNLGEAWRLAVGKELGDKIVSLMDTLPAAFANPLPSLHPFDLFIGLCCGTGMRLAVYLKGKNAKKYRHGMEYGSARWGGPKDIEPFMAPKFEDNIILTKTERLMMSNRPPDPKNARNKNVLVVGGSGSGKTRFFIKPNLLQCDSKNFPVSFVVTDPKGSIGVECGEALLKHGYKLKFFNTINFSKSMRYNPMAYIHSEKDVLKLVTALMTNTKGEGQGGDPFWDKAERLLLVSLIAYLHYEAPVEEQNFATLLEMLNTMQVSEDDETYQNPVDLLFEDLGKKKPNSFAVRQYKLYKLAAGKTARSILISCGARMAPFDIQEVRDATMYDELELDKLGDRKTALFLIMSDLPMLKEFCKEQFVSKGMIADFAIHDKGDGNPHAHILLTIRAMDEHGKWLPKARKVYDLDENSERIQLPSGNWKCHKENTVDWNDQKYAEVWRHSWEVVTNHYLEAAGRPERVDLRSFERQGVQQIPTVHLGPAAHQMEKRGIETFLGNLNRDIRAANSLMQSIRSTIRGLQRWIADLTEKKQILLDALEQAKEPTLSDLLVDYFNLRNEQRSDWSSKAQLKCSARDLNEVMQAVDYLKAHSLNTVEDLNAAIKDLSQTAAPLRKQLKQNENRMRAIAQIKDAAAIHAKLKPIHDTFLKKNFKLTKDAYAAQHKEELDAFNKAVRTLMKLNGGTTVDFSALDAEFSALQSGSAELRSQLETLQPDLTALKNVRKYIDLVLNKQQLSAPGGKTPEKESVLKQLEQLQQEKSKHKAITAMNREESL